MSGEGATQQFLPLKALVEAVMSQDKETWLEKHPDAFLILDNPGDGVENASFQTIDAGRAKSGGGKAEEILRKLSAAGSYVFLLRREKNKFASMITVGRAANNALRLNVGSVSKFHAYFTYVARDGCWYLADAHSSNATFVDGKELPPSHGKQPVRSGSVLRFGPDVTAQFFDAEGFWDMLHGSGALSGPETVAVTGEEAKRLRKEIAARPQGTSSEGEEASDAQPAP
ncbi:MAG: FHA domain-containing protein [Planctomycetota bacterium]|nr:MAG: FHA domain-containing protein [Planctomycetota bacterium]